MSNLLQNIGFSLGLIAAPALAYAESGTWVPADAETASRAKTEEPQKYMAKKKSTAAGSSSSQVNKTEYELTTGALKLRTETLKEKNEEQDKKLEKVASESQRSAERSEDRDINLGRRLGVAEEKVAQIGKDVADLSSQVQGADDAYSQRFALETGLHYTRSDVNRISAQAALCYLGNRITLCAGGGVGKAGESTSATDLSRPAAYEQDGKYIEASLQTGTETSGQRYQWNASARVAPAYGSPVGKLWEVTPHLTLEVLFNKERVTTNLTRTTQLYHDNQAVGNPVTASGSDTEYSTGRAFVPGVGFDACRTLLWSRNSGNKALCARLGLGYDLQNETGVLSLGMLAKFQ